LWQQHRQADDDSFGVYSSMMADKLDSYDDNQDIEIKNIIDKLELKK